MNVHFHFIPIYASWLKQIEVCLCILSRAALNSPLKKSSLTGFHATTKHIAAKAVSPSSETMRTT